MNFKKRGCLTLLATLLLVACGAEPRKELVISSRDSTKPPIKDQADQGSKQEKIVAAKSKPTDLLNPADARAFMLTQPAMSSANADSTLRVPVLTLTLRQADYAWVLRCNSSYSATTALGEDVFALPANTPNLNQQMRWAWQEALGAPQHCLQVASKTISATLEDLTAPTGEYYYLVNPCLLKDKSANKNEVCSYSIVKTASVKVDNKLSREFIIAAQKVAETESAHASLLLRLRYFAEVVQLNREACEHNNAVTLKQENLWKGLGSLLATGIGAMASGIVSGGTTALQGARLGLNFAQAIFGKQDHVQLQCPILADTLKAAQEVTAALPEAQSKVLGARNELAFINGEYARMDEKIMNDESAGH